MQDSNVRCRLQGKNTANTQSSFEANSYKCRCQPEKAGFVLREEIKTHILRETLIP